jgi:hypothetical protein
MSKPNIESTLTGLKMTWDKEQIEADIRRIRRRRDDNVTAEITLRTWAPGYNPHLHNTLLNLNSSTSKGALARRLSELYGNFPWDDIVEQVAVAALAHFRVGEPVTEIWSDGTTEPLQYLLHPLLPLNKPTVFYGDGGVGKSLVTLMLGIIVALPWMDNPLELNVDQEPIPTLLLDWETDKDDVAWRTQCIQRGHGLHRFKLLYRRCILPLAEDIEPIQQMVMDAGVKMIVVDSVGQACGGDLNDAQAAIEMFRAIRSLNVTSLLVAHVSKDTSKAKTPIGTAYFRNTPRSVWEVRKAQLSGEDKLSVGLFHKKTNVSKVFPPIGISITFRDDTIVFEREDVRGVAEFVEELSTSQRILGLLKNGTMTTKEIAAQISRSYDVTSVTLKRMMKRQQVIKVGDKWDLLAENTV